MALYLQSNTAALNAENYFNTSNNAINSDFTQLSSGYRINSAADDAAGLGIAKAMNAQVQSYTVAGQNANDGISMVQTADGSADQIDSLLTSMRSLAVEAQNGTMSSNDTANLATVFNQDLAEINRVAGDATFNGATLLAGAATTVSFQVGINGTSNDQISVSFGGCDASGLGISNITITSATVLTSIDSAMQTLDNNRAGFGAAMDRLQDASTQISSTQTNLSSALSTIQDVDVASATADLAREQVLAQAGASVLSQANQAPQLALKLLQ
ncbi:MAG: flagellin [Polyangiaceae bacterium]|jgi:flagellin